MVNYKWNLHQLHHIPEHYRQLYAYIHTCIV